MICAGVAFAGARPSRPPRLIRLQAAVLLAPAMKGLLADRDPSKCLGGRAALIQHNLHLTQVPADLLGLMLPQALVVPSSIQTVIVDGPLIKGQLSVNVAANDAFVDFLYRNVLNREPDAAGRADWINRLNGDPARSDALLSSRKATSTKAQTAATIAQRYFVTDDAHQTIALL